MKSVKPGRGPSAMGAFGSLIGIVFGVFWTIIAASSGAPVFFPIFGILFILIGIAQAVYHFKNATGETRFSAFDITEDGEEPDPLDRRGYDVPQPPPVREQPPAGRYRFCPYCGAELREDFVFCGVCGRQLPGIRKEDPST